MKVQRIKSKKREEERAEDLRQTILQNNVAPIQIRGEQPLQPLSMEIAEWLPGIGDAIQFGNAINAASKGNLKAAGLLFGTALLPGAIDKVVKKPVKKLISKSDNVTTHSFRKLTPDEINSNEWSFLDAPAVPENYGMSVRQLYNTPTEIQRIQRVKAENTIKTPSIKEKFFSKTPQEQDAMVRAWRGEEFNSFESLKGYPKKLASFWRWISK